MPNTENFESAFAVWYDSNLPGGEENFNLTLTTDQIYNAIIEHDPFADMGKGALVKALVENGYQRRVIDQQFEWLILSKF